MTLAKETKSDVEQFVKVKWTWQTTTKFRIKDVLSTLYDISLKNTSKHIKSYKNNSKYKAKYALFKHVSQGRSSNFCLQMLREKRAKLSTLVSRNFGVRWTFCTNIIFLKTESYMKLQKSHSSAGWCCSIANWLDSISLGLSFFGMGCIFLGVCFNLISSHFFLL